MKKRSTNSLILQTMKAKAVFMFFVVLGGSCFSYLMYLADFDEFMAASVKVFGKKKKKKKKKVKKPLFNLFFLQLFQSNPLKTRYCMKLRGEDKVVVLKVTDDKIVIKHKIKVQRDLNKKLEQWNTTFLRLAAGH